MKKILYLLNILLIMPSCKKPSSQTRSKEYLEAKKREQQNPLKQHILTPDTVTTKQLGTLNFFDGLPSKNTTEKLYNNLDFTRAVEAFLYGISLASMYALRKGFRSQGADNNSVILVYENLMNSIPLYLTANTGTVYTVAWMDLKKGPVVVESPPNTLGFVNDFFCHYITDLGNAGPDKGKGGKYLFIPSDYKGEIPTGYFTYTSPTYGNLILWRGFAPQGDPKNAVKNIKKHTKIYSLADKNNPPKNKFINVSNKPYNTIPANDFEFYNQLNEVVQEEPPSAFGPQLLGIFWSIGIQKGKPFKPDTRMRAILEEAVKVGNATARSLSFRPRQKEAYLYKDSNTWFNPFHKESHAFITSNGAYNIDARTRYYYCCIGMSPAMVKKSVGNFSQYGLAAIDKHGNYFDGGKTYTLTLPPNVPAKRFWSIVLYDPQTRSMLQVPGRPFPSINSIRSNTKTNKDGSYTIWFSPKKPDGVDEGNWLKTVPGKSWFTLFRAYGPLEAWFDRSWRLGEFEPIT